MASKPCASTPQCLAGIPPTPTPLTGVRPTTATDLPNPCANNPLCDPTQAARIIGDVISIAVVALIWVAALSAIFFLLYGSFIYITAGDNPKNRERAIAILTWTIVGLVIASSAYGIMKIISSALPTGLPGFGD